MSPQPNPMEEATVVLQDKIIKMIKRGYHAPAETRLLSLIKYFVVPKGEGNCRVVYHAGQIVLMISLGFTILLANGCPPSNSGSYLVH